MTEELRAKIQAILDWHLKQAESCSHSSQHSSDGYMVRSSYARMAEFHGTAARDLRTVLGISPPKVRRTALKKS